jgi:hypothetical protein
MASHLDFGYNFFKHKIAHLHQIHDTFGLPWQHDDDKTDLVIRLEKYAADYREVRGINCKKYLSPGFLSEHYFMPMLRSVLSQYGVHYGPDPKRPRLVEIFMDQLPYLKRMNGLGQPDAQTESLTDNFCSMDVNASGKPTRKSRSKKVDFDTPTRVQPPRQAKQTFAAPGNAYRAPPYDAFDPNNPHYAAAKTAAAAASAAADASAARADAAAAAARADAADAHAAAAAQGMGYPPGVAEDHRANYPRADPQAARPYDTRSVAGAAGHQNHQANYPRADPQAARPYDTRSAAGNAGHQDRQANYPRADPQAAHPYDTRSAAGAAGHQNHQAKCPRADIQAAGSYDPRSTAGVAGQVSPESYYRGASTATGRGVPAADFDQKFNPNLASGPHALAVFSVHHDSQNYGYHPQTSTNTYRDPTVDNEAECSDDNEDNEEDGDVVTDHLIELLRRDDRAGVKRLLHKFSRNR